jgi:hypothetical protein
MCSSRGDVLWVCFAGLVFHFFSLTWLLKFIKQLYPASADDLNCHIPIKKVKQGDRFYIKLFDNAKVLDVVSVGFLRQNMGS